jgi:prevent-host-death family protein
MRLADHVKPISYLQSDAAQIVRDLTASGEPLFITQNGEAKFVVQDVQSYENTQKTLALFKLLALGKQDIRQGKFTDAAGFLAELDDLDRNERID